MYKIFGLCNIDQFTFDIHIYINKISENNYNYNYKLSYRIDIKL